MSNSSVGKRLFFTIVLIFVLFALAFVLFQYQRERTYKRQLIETQLKEYNIHFAESIQQYDGNDTIDYCRRFVRRHPARNLIVTVSHNDGTIIFSTDTTHTAPPDNYLYSTTPFPRQRLVITTAMPVDLHLAEMLSTDKTYLYFAAFMMVILCIALYRFTAPLGRNITKLRRFADKITNNEPIHSTDLTDFPDDELGEIAERIVTFYHRWQRTKEEQNRLKRELTHNIAHELKTPAAGIMGYLETIINNKQITPDLREQFIQRSFALSKRLAALITDISVLNRMDEYNPAKHTPESVEVGPIIERIYSECNLQLADKHITFNNNVPQNACVGADPAYVYSIFRNLTDNSIAYAGDGITITIDAQRSGQYWQFIFADNGAGVDQHHLPRLFERFYRTDEGRTRAAGGTGLGLAIVRNAVVIYGGTITVTGGKGVGLTFRFTLPAFPAHPSDRT
ncbi:MAG: HAMP domain-containing histidine kinase [Prevotella sp.]|nr:HAMP domain-containing histidine kinase [Prevotella sp.]